MKTVPNVGIVPYSSISITFESEEDAYSPIMTSTINQQKDGSWPVDVRITFPHNGKHLIVDQSWAYLTKSMEIELNDEDLAYVLGSMAASTIRSANQSLRDRGIVIPYTWEMVQYEVMTAVLNGPAKGLRWHK